jgi:uncharacterized membrane-anchored protein YitT (DUF2179 family)
MSQAEKPAISANADLGSEKTRKAAGHRWLFGLMWVDLYGYALAGVTISLGLIFLHQCQLVTSGVAGIALLAAHLVPVNPSLLFGLFNIPFFAVAWAMMGREFAIRSFAVTIGIVTFGTLVARHIDIRSLDPVIGSVMGGSLIGLGVLFATRHAAGVGGTVILMITLNRRFGWNMGLQGAAIDLIVILASIPVFGWLSALLSALSAACVNLVLYAFHRS